MLQNNFLNKLIHTYAEESLSFVCVECVCAHVGVRVYACVQSLLKCFFGSGKKHEKQQYLVFRLVLSPHYSEQTLLLPCAFLVVSCLE